MNVDSLSSELRWLPGQGLQAVAGLGVVRQRRAGRDEQEPIASIVLRQPLSDATSVRASLARRVRAPSVVQLFDPQRGNADLNMERVTTAELGLDWRGKGVEWNSTLFQSNVRDFIRQDDASQRSANLDCARLRGLETSARWRLLPSLTVQPAYTWLNAVDCSAGAAFSRLAYRPRHKISADLRWQATPDTSVGLNVVHVRNQVHDSRNGPAQQASLPAYTLWGLNAHWNLAAWQLSAFVDNLTDEAYSTSYGFPQAGRTFWVRGSLRF